AEGLDRLLVAGGDGTWHHAARGLAGSDTALAPIPVGTGNDLARELGYPLDTARAFSAALEGRVERIDLGRIGGRLFCGVAGVGFDAAVAEYARERVRMLRGPAVYAWATFATLASYRTPSVRLDGGEADFEGEVFLVAFANTSHYGGGMRIAPHADPGDGRLEVVIVRRVSKLRLLSVFPRVYRGAHIGHPAIEVRAARSVAVTFGSPQRINADGESAGWTGPGPLAVAVVPGALAVVRAPAAH
ncbi:MAG: diacylglycerol kinase family lipid kinase, partial [Thermoanaerobaculia bacterium]